MTSQESFYTEITEEAALISSHNQPEYTVSELAGAIKRTIEGNFGYVRVRGEISGCKRASSGHIYLDLKDDKALINAVCWKGVAGKLPLTPEDGLEVICTGRMSSYPGRSNYQLVIEQMELAGAGALMALLEQRKKALAAEGLFDAERKLPLPYLPKVIGVVTSPTGAVIRDILHRLSDRFPCHVLLIPVAVQGKGAEAQIAAAITMFNSFDGTHTPPRPDVLIVARGGGSMEDLWCFNEEVVVRAAAASTIPLISAVGHETDTTLIDFAASKRAPTPTAAAEMAVPVLAELRQAVGNAGLRLEQATLRQLQQRSDVLNALSRGLISPERALELKMQRMDEWSERLTLAMQSRLKRSNEAHIALMARLRVDALLQRTSQMQERLHQLDARLHHAWCCQEKIWEASLDNVARMLQSLSHQNVLKRGFAYVTGEQQQLIASVKTAKASPTLTLHFHDGDVTLGQSPVVPTTTASPKRLRKSSKASVADDKQQGLFD